MEDETYNRFSNRDMQIVKIGLLRVIEYRTYTILQNPMQRAGADKAPKAFMESKPYNRSPNADMQIVQIKLIRIIQFRKYIILQGPKQLAQCR